MVKSKIRVFRFIFIFLIISLFTVPLVAMASDITNAIFRGIIQATNTGPLASDVAANFTLSTNALIAAGQLNSSANNVVARDDAGNTIPVMPGYNGGPWIIYYGSIMAGVSRNTNIYTGNVTGGKIRYFPNGTGMSIADSPTLEPGNNFSISINGTLFYTTAGAGKILLNHSDTTNGGIQIVYSPTVSGNISVNWGTLSSSSQPNSNGDIIQLSPDGAGTNWGCTSDMSDATAVYSAASTTYYEDLYQISDSSLTTEPITSVIAYFRYKNDTGGATSYVKPTFKIGSTSYNGTEQSVVGTTYTTQNQTYAVSPATGLAWTWSELNGLKYGIWAHGSGANRAYVADVWLVAYNGSTSYTYFSNSLSVAGITLAEHDMTISGNTTHIRFSIDGIIQATSTFTTIPNSTANWTIGSANTTPYIQGISISVNGTLRGSWSWQYGATFTDQSGNGNTGTPSFRTTSSDSDVTTSLISFLPLSQAVADQGIISAWPKMITSAPDQPSTMYSENSMPGIPGASLLHAIWPKSIPESFFWYNFTFATIIGAGVLTFYLLAAKGQNGLLLKCIVMSIVMTFWALPGPNVYGMYVVIYFDLWCFGVIVLSRNYGW